MQATLDGPSCVSLTQWPAQGKSVITALYVAKYGVPPASSKVFVSVTQLNGGYEDNRAAEVNRSGGTAPKRGAQCLPPTPLRDTS